MACGRCGEEGHNARTCATRHNALTQPPDELDSPGLGDPTTSTRTRRCARCRRRGHRADRCLSPYPLVGLGEGQYTVPPDMLVVVMSRRYWSPTLNLDGQRDELVDVIMHGDGRARVYLRDRLDWRVAMGGLVPWVGTLRDLGAHWEAHNEGELCPVQVAVPVVRKLCPHLVLALPVWDDDELEELGQ